MAIRRCNRPFYKKFVILSALRIATNLVSDHKPPGYWTTEKIITLFKAFFR
ncbi:MAG: hypothetical protein QM768_22520 [Agriterribacter sp.]